MNNVSFSAENLPLIVLRLAQERFGSFCRLVCPGPGIAIVLLFLLAAGSAATAQNQELQTREVFIFPGDIAFVYKAGDLQFRDRRVVLAEIPNAIQGTYWLKPGGNFEITKTEFAMDTVYHQREAVTFFDVLKANVGAQSLVTYQIGEDIEDVSGEILPFVAGSDLARIKRPNGSTTFIHREQLRQVAIQGKSKTLYWEATLGQATIIEISKPLSRAEVQMFYYTRGIRWEPIYSTKIVSDTSMILSMKCFLENNAESFRDAQVKFVIGEPNLNYAGGDPNLDQTTRELVQYLQSPVDSEELVSTGGAPANETDEAEPTTGSTQRAGEQGLYVFEVGRLTLQSPGQAEVPVFEQPMEARVMHTARLPLHLDEATGEPLQVEDLLFTSQLALRFRNTTGSPLLPGSLLLMDVQDRPLGQDKMPALRPGEETFVYYSEAPEVQVFVTERLQSREEKFKKINGEHHDRLRVRGSVRVQNNSKEFHRVRVSQEVLGELRRTSNGEVTVVGERFGSPLKTLTWEIPVGADMSQTYTYEYEYFLPHR